MENENKNYVYVVALDEVYDGETGDCTVFVYDSLEKAEGKIRLLYEIGKKNEYFDKDESQIPDYVDLYNDGYYSRYHFHARIEKREVE